MIRALIGLTMGAIFAVVLISTGALDSLAADGEIDRTILGSIIVYWFLLTGTLGFTAIGRRFPRETLLISGSISLGIALTAGISHWLAPRQNGLPMPRFRGLPSPDFHHIYPANVRMNSGTFDGHQVLVETNDDGLRTHHSPADFLAFDTRIIILGDSFTFGFGVRQDHTFPVLAEKMLRERRPQRRLGILSAGIISYSPFLHRLLYKGKLSRLRPHLVVMFLDVSDIGDDYRYAHEWQEAGGQGFVNIDAGEAASRSPLFALPWTRELGIYFRYPLETIGIRSGLFRPQAGYDYYHFRIEIDGTIEKNRFFLYRHPLAKTKTHFDNTLHWIQETADAVRNDGGRFLLMVPPRYHHWNPRECPDNWESKFYRNDEPYQFEFFRFFQEAQTRVDFPIISLLEDFQGTNEFPLVFSRDPHWNERGHAFVASLTANFLHARGGLPSP
jgi:hypothetical protein